MKFFLNSPLLFFGFIFTLHCGDKVNPEQKYAFPEDVGFHDIRVAIMETKCTRCHLDMASTTGLQKYVTPGLPERSELYTIVLDDRMPPSGTKLSQEEKDAIYRWIENGGTL